MASKTASELLDEFYKWQKESYSKVYESFELEKYTEVGFGTFDGVFLLYVNGKCEDIIPVEVKADTDRFDERLPRQIATQLSAFGTANLVLGSRKLTDRKRDILKWLPVNVYQFQGGNPASFDEVQTIGLDNTYGQKIGWFHIGVRGSRGHVPEIETIEKLWAKALLNQIRYGKEVPFTKTELHIFDLIRATSGYEHNEEALLKLIDGKQEKLTPPATEVTGIRSQDTKK